MPTTRPLNGCSAALLLAGLLTLPGAVSAATPPVVEARPERTSAMFGDWSVTCTHPSRSDRQCEAALMIQAQSGQRAVLALGRAAQTEPLRLVIQVPVNIRTLVPVQLTVDAGPVIRVPFASCNRLGCFADVAALDDLVPRLRALPAGTSTARIEWHDSADAVITLPVSTKGFAAALDNLQSEERK